MKLMIVDDHAEIRRLIRELLGHLADAVCECASAEEAIQRCEQFEPDFVTMDLNMKEMNGLQATRRILARLPGAEVAIVAQSDADGLARAAADAGASGYFPKNNLAALLVWIVLRAQPEPGQSQQVPPNLAWN